MFLSVTPQRQYALTKHFKIVCECSGFTFFFVSVVVFRSVFEKDEVGDVSTSFCTWPLFQVLLNKRP